MTPSPREFRWQVHSDAMGDDWTAWHTTALPCRACCCNGPEDGEHLHGTMDYDEYEAFTGTHRRLDPTDVEPWQHVEWRPAHRADPRDQTITVQVGARQFPVTFPGAHDHLVNDDGTLDILDASRITVATFPAGLVQQVLALQETRLPL